MGQAVVFVSGKGGVGKTTIVANIGLELAQMGKSVIMVDTDIGLRKLDLTLGMANAIVYDYMDVLDGICRMRQAIVKTHLEPNLFMMSPSQTKQDARIDPEDMKLLINKLKSEYDYVLIDAPTGINEGFDHAVACGDMAVVVAIPDLSSIRDAENVIRILRMEKYASHHIKLVVNQIRPHLIQSGELPTIEDIYSRLRADMVGLLPYDEKFIVATNKGVPISSNGDPVIKGELAKITSRIVNNTCLTIAEKE